VDDPGTARHERRERNVIDELQVSSCAGDRRLALGVRRLVGQRELVTLIFEEAGKQPKMGEAPSLVFKVVGLFVPIMRELAEMLYQWERPYHFNHDKFERAFGKQPVTSHRDAVRETVKWFREKSKEA